MHLTSDAAFLVGIGDDDIGRTAWARIESPLLALTDDANVLVAMVRLDEVAGDEVGCLLQSEIVVEGEIEGDFDSIEEQP